VTLEPDPTAYRQEPPYLADALTLRGPELGFTTLTGARQWLHDRRRDLLSGRLARLRFTLVQPTGLAQLLVQDALLEGLVDRRGLPAQTLVYLEPDLRPTPEARDP
jgi:hypothetical protein